jgi:hypothetical protein
VVKKSNNRKQDENGSSAQTPVDENGGRHIQKSLIKGRPLFIKKLVPIVVIRTRSMEIRTENTARMNVMYMTGFGGRKKAEILMLILPKVRRKMMMSEMKWQSLSVDALKPAAYNPRKKLKTGDKEYEKIKNSILEFGYVEPIIVNYDMTVIGGHQRLTVLKDLGYKEVQCVIVEIKDENKVKALNIALNKISVLGMNSYWRTF